MQKKYLLFFAGFLLVLNIFAWQEVFILNQPHYLTVNFLSVGQGDSALLKTPQGNKILIDGGPDSTVLQKLSENMPFWDRTIDMVILSHPESDHMTGIFNVFQRYNVKYFLWTGVLKDGSGGKKLSEILDKAQSQKVNFLAALTGTEKTKVIDISAGAKIKAGNVLINILYPLENLAGKEIKNSVNDTAIVNSVIYGKNTFLFTGDIGSKAEKELANLYGLNLKADVLKVAHHGSKYSTSDLFLQTVQPEVAVIEVGKNSYGHPTEEVLNRLKNFGIQIKRTDQDGDVRFISDGNTIKLIK